MTRTRRVVLTLVLRSFLVQGSWNYRNLQGSGLAWGLLPFLRRASPGQVAEGVRRHAEPFNSHPYLTSLAMGALARVESDGASFDRVRSFRDAIRSPLGSLGDGLIWFAWLPTCLIGAIVAALWGWPPWIVIGGLLVAYNALHIILRFWGATVGWDLGFRVGEALGRIDIPRQTERISGAGVLLFGFMLGLLPFRGPEFSGPGLGWWFAGMLFLLLGFTLGATARKWAPRLLLFLVVLGFLIDPAWVRATGG